MIGYLGYFFLLVFYPVQLFGMISKRNIDLGILPMISLSVGLMLLQFSYVGHSIPHYIVVGNATSLIFSCIILTVVYLKDRYVQTSRKEVS